MTRFQSRLRSLYNLWTDRHAGQLQYNPLAHARRVLMICFHSPPAVAPQTVTLVSLSPQPTCPNQVLVYNCQVQFPSLVIRWEHPGFETLGFTARDDAVGTIKSASDGRVIANLTMNEGKSLHRMVASTLTIQPPLNDLNSTNLNGTNLICQGHGIQNGTKNEVVTIHLTGECQRM